MNRLEEGMGRRQKDREFEALLGDHAGILVKVSRAYAWNEDDRQDLVQEIQLQLWKSFKGYDPQRSFSTWMYRIALNVAISYVRRNAGRVRSQVGLDRAALETVQISEADPRIGLIESFMRELDELNRALLLLYLDDVSHREIAETLGISESNVGTKIGRIKERLRAKIA